MLVRWLPLVALCLGCSSGSGDLDGPAAREEAIAWNASIATEDPRAATSELRALTEDVGGYVSASETRSDWARLQLRIPASELGTLRERLTALDPDVHLAEQAEDVTEAHGDLSARLRNQRATEVRLLALLDDRTAALADVLAAERELSRVREQIEMLETGERALVRRVAFADVTVAVQLRSPGWLDAPLDAVGSAFTSGAHAALSLALGTTVIATAILPSAALLLAFGLLSRTLYRRLRV
jgi:hypothetical protein